MGTFFPSVEAGRGEPGRSGERRGWLAWLRGLPGPRRWGPALAVAAYWSLLAAVRGLAGENVLLGLAVLGIAYAGVAADTWFRFLIPLALVGAVYDAQRFLIPLLRGWVPVHVSEPRAFDLRYFGIHSVSGTMTPAEWMQHHTCAALDLPLGLAYLGFIPAFVATAAWLRFGPPGRARPAGPMMWSLLWLVAVSCATYHLYPAAPPWYAERFGFGPARADAAPSPAGEVRIDRLVGVPLFASIYSKAPDVFGAIPSLHAAIPLLAFLFACRARALRAATGLYALAVCAAAVYFNHHYLLDLLVGAAYAAAVWSLTPAGEAGQGAGRRAPAPPGSAG